MAAITAAMVKDLRGRTGLGMMDCKKALVEADGDAELAIENLRKSSGMKAAKKAGRTQQTEKSASKLRVAPVLLLKLTARLTSRLKIAISSNLFLR